MRVEEAGPGRMERDSRTSSLRPSVGLRDWRPQTPALIVNGACSACATSGRLNRFRPSGRKDAARTCNAMAKRGPPRVLCLLGLVGLVAARALPVTRMWPNIDETSPVTEARARCARAEFSNACLLARWLAFDPFSLASYSGSRPPVTCCSDLEVLPGSPCDPEHARQVVERLVCG